MGKEAQKQLEPHPFANMLPLMSEDQFTSFKADIAEIGQTDPIELFEGKILDGRHRYRACCELKITPKIITFKGTSAEALDRVCSRENRRQVTESQRAAAAINSLPHIEAQAAQRKKAGSSASVRGGDQGKASEIAARKFRVSPRYVEMAKALHAGDRQLFQQVFEGALPLSRATRQLQRKTKARQWASDAKQTKLSEDDCRIIVGDCRKVLKRVPDASVDLVVTDPPYGIGDTYNSFNDRLTRAELMKIIGGGIDQMMRTLKPHASVFMMMSSRYALDVAELLSKAGLHRQDTIIWAHSFGAHNCKFFTDSYRVIHFYTKHPTKFTFNWQDQRAYVPSWRGKNEDARRDGETKLPGNVWGVWTDDDLAMLVDNDGERIPSKLAPNQLPVKLIERIVLLASNPGDHVLDTHHGTGTSARASLMHGRRYTGIEIDAKVADASRGWIKAHLAKVRAA